MTRRPPGCGRRGQEVPGSGGGGLEDVGFFFFSFYHYERPLDWGEERGSGGRAGKR